MSLARIRTGDTVIVLSGKDKGKTGRVVRVWPELGRVVVEKLNLVKRHTKPSQTQQQGGIFEKEAQLPMSKIALVTDAGKATRVKTQTNEDRSKNRVAVKGGKVIEPTRA